MKEQPPRWAERFLTWFCNPVFLEEIEGDIYELFEKRMDMEGPRRARLRFVWDVFRFFRWSNIKRSNSKYFTMYQVVLFKNYVKLGFRNITRNLVSSSINIFGLAIAIAMAITTFVFVDMQLNMDQFHTQADRIFQLTNYVEQEGGQELWGDSPLLIGPALQADHPEIEAFARMEYSGAHIRYGDDVFEETLVFVDPTFMEMFDYPILYGNKKVLYDKNAIVISREMAIKYFSDEDPIGKEMTFKFPSGAIKRFTVGTVLDKWPYNTHMKESFYVPIANFFDLHEGRVFDWDYFTDATFVLLKKPEDISTLTNAFNRYVELQIASNPEWRMIRIEPIPLTELSLEAYRIVSAVNGGSHPAGRIALIIVACLLLGMACFNFMNISVAAAVKRLKEIAMRKVMGGLRKQIVYQFMVENFLQCLFALIAGTAIAYFFLVPGFDAAVLPMEIRFRAYAASDMVLFFLLLLLITTFVSGAYPAFYISKFQPVSIFKGSQKLGSRNLFSKILLGVQLFLAFQTIVGCFLYLDQAFYNASKDWGYDPSGTFSVRVDGQAQYEQLRNIVSEHPDVISFAASTGQMGRGIPTMSFEDLNKQFRVRVLNTSDEFFETMNLRLLEGRFLTQTESDQNAGAVINERFVRKMNWEDPINQKFTFDSVDYTVVGVVEDFYYTHFYADIDPVMIRGMGNATPSYFTVKTAPENAMKVDQFAKQAWQEVSPYDAYDREFQEDVFDWFFIENDANIKIVSVITLCAVILACLGLYGLLAYNIQKNLKEFSIRKVLGASSIGIAKIASKQYAPVVIIAFILGAPLGVWGMNMMITSLFPDPKGITPTPFVISILLILATLLLTIAGQILKAINVNPATILKAE